MLIKGKYRCINCFRELNAEDEICSCGYDITQYEQATHRLMPGTVLENHYYVGRVIGEGGFGITYVGYDENLDIKLAIKEFYLNGISSRNTTVSSNIETGVGEQERLFETYRDKFINEARTLAKFNDEEGVVSILNFFKSNNTAYIIMEFLDGETLKEYLKRKTRLSVDETIELFLPIMKTLDDVHKTKLIHRDISPDNIIFTKKGKVKLLDFGAARDVSNDNKSLSVVLKHGYAPPEQYQTHGKQGSWTDVYALSATIYKCLTGKTPNEAMDRTLGEELEPVYVITSDCPKNISDVIMKGLEIKITDRYQSMGEMAEALTKAQKEIEGKPVLTDKEDSDATVLLFDEKKSDESNEKTRISKEIVDDTADRKVESPKKDTIVNEAAKKSVTNVPDEKISIPANESDEVTDQKRKTVNMKPLVIVLAAVILCAIVGLSIMLYGKSGKTQDEKEIAQTVAEDNDESMEEESAINEYEGGDVEINDTVSTNPYAYLKSAQVGDIVEFGNYNGFTTWRVLAKDDNTLMLITENVVDRHAFNDENVECDWSSCTLRTWLNSDYYNSAFSDEEKALIKESNIDGGKDKVFLLSSDEARTYFKDDTDRVAHNTEYEKEYSIEAAYGIWWLRSPVSYHVTRYIGSCVNGDGLIREGSFGVDFDDDGVRPALNIDISKIESQNTESTESTVKNSEDEEKTGRVEENENAIINEETKKKYAYLKSAQVGDIIEFGNYNGFTTWRVLAKDDTTLMLITENVVDRHAFNDEKGKCDWSSCTLRTWLNSDYYNSAFTDEEKTIIKDSDIDGGKDKVFLLSSDEARTYFKDDNDRIAHNTEYEKKYSIKAPYGHCWWLRSPVNSDDYYYYGSYVYEGGRIHEGGYFVTYDSIGIRPALNIDISNL